MTQPRTYLIGMTEVHRQGIAAFLNENGHGEFLDQFRSAYLKVGPVAVCSLYAKLCYRSLTLGQNSNVTATRDIQDNLHGCFDVGHGSVFEHFTLNFVTVNCSRVFTHELVRHRVGTAFSQTSGRYCTPESAEMVLPPDAPDWLVARYEQHLEDTKMLVQDARDDLGVDSMPMAEKKRWTSTLRRAMPSGADNEIGWSVNIRALRHLIQMRTNPAAEWEIRRVFTDVARIIEKICPLMLYGGKKTTTDDLDHWENLHV